MQTAPQMTAPATAEADALADAVLDRYVSRRWQPDAGDSGPAVLAALVALVQGRQQRSEGALEQWLEELDAGPAHLGLFGRGLAGYALGAAFAAGMFAPECSRLARTTRTAVARNVLDRICSTRVGRTDWSDYDLVTGPTGAMVAMATSTMLDPVVVSDACAPVASAVAHLVDDGFAALRVTEYGDDPLRSWNRGHINTGVAHGAGGVVAALTTVLRRHPELAEAVRPSLRAGALWLAAESFVDDAGVLTWSVAALEGRHPTLRHAPRQAWCYGTPGLAWVLWDAADLLGDPSLCALARAAMSSFAAAFDPIVHLEGSDPGAPLAVCHGAAGTLAVADAFVRWAGMDEVAPLADALCALLLAHAGSVLELATTDMRLLTGASGIASVLLAHAHPELDRAWLAQMVLR